MTRRLVALTALALAAAAPSPVHLDFARAFEDGADTRAYLAPGVVTTTRTAMPGAPAGPNGERGAAEFVAEGAEGTEDELAGLTAQLGRPHVRECGPVAGEAGDTAVCVFGGERGAVLYLQTRAQAGRIVAITASVVPAR